MDMDILISLLFRAVFMSTPLILGALGEIIAERTGMMVCAVEGIFLAGAWGGFIGVYTTGSYFMGFALALGCGLLVAMLYGLTTVYMHQHQIVMGTAIAILMTGFCKFFYRAIFGTPMTPLKIDPLPVIEIPLLSDIPVIGPILFAQNIISYLTYILVIVITFVIFKTSLGLTLRSCGENPEAADVAGINVRRIRFLAVSAAGCLGGIAGAYYTICNAGMYSNEIISGRGWIAFGICFLGNWKPLGSLLFGITFGICDALGIFAKTSEIGFIPTEFFNALPYLLIIVLTVCRKKLSMPAKLGTNYIKEG